MKQTDVHFLKPTRVSTLSSGEEKLRSHLTWQMFDQKLYECAFGPEKELGEFVVDPAAFLRKAVDTVVEIEDEIPLWLAVGVERKIVSNKKWLQHRRARGRKKAVSKMKKVARAQAKAKGLARAAPRRDTYIEGDILKGAMTSGQDKLRVTLVDRNVVKHYFNIRREPEGQRLKQVLVVPGVWANLDNITLTKPHRWIKEEKLLIDKEEKVRRAGTGTEGAMREWVQLRHEEPDLFHHTTVMQSPSANRDEVNSFLSARGGV